MPEMKSVGVLGAGLMGAGIAQVAAQSGFDTRVREVSDALCQRAKAGIEKQMNKAIEKGKLTAEQRDAAMARLSFTTAVKDLKDCDIVIEAVVEDLDAQERDVEGARRPLPAAHDLRLQHLDPHDRRDGRGHQRGPTGSSACTSSTRCR